jgi:hypothetical protein
VLVFLCACSGWLTFHFFELKPYSADAFWGLALPALAAWAAEPVDDREAFGGARRPIVWWTIAAAGQWFGNGALLVTPFCAIVLVTTIRTRRGIAAAFRSAAPCVIWAAAFALHFWLAMRFTWGSRYLHEVWAGAMPPESAAFAERLHWLGAQLAPFALKPGGSGFAALFWGVALGGLVIAAPVDVALRLAFLTVPLAGFLLTGLRLVPLFERLSLWMLPAIYVGIALAADTAARLVRHGVARRRLPALAAALVVVLAVAPLAVDIGTRGIENVGIRAPLSNHELDDRSAVRWLMARRQPGDVVLSTYLALPAVWWYGGVSIAPPGLGGRLPDGSPIFEVKYVQPDADCRADALRAALTGHTRALVYFGFRFDDVPAWWDDFLLDRLSAVGNLSIYKPFAQRSRVAIFDLRAEGRPTGARYGAPDSASANSLGCIGVQPALRW